MINLDKGSKISLDKDLGGIKALRLGVGWFPKGYVARRFREGKAGQPVSSAPQEKKGFMNKLGDFFKGDARAGDVVNAATDTVRRGINNLDDSFARDAMSAVQDVDVDTSVMVLSHGRVIEVAAFSNSRRELLGGGLYHHGDNTTGRSDDMEGDKEQVDVNFDKLERYDSSIDEVIMFVNVFGARSNGQHFGAFGGGFARLSDQNNNELAFFNLNDKYDKQEGIYLLRVYKYNSDWRVEALGIPVKKASHYKDMVEDYKKNGFGR